MNLENAKTMAATGRLYPSVILYGANAEARQEAALDMARGLLCGSSEGRPCSACEHCRRITWPVKGQEQFHPDLHVLERDLKTATSAGATKAFLEAAYSSPFEARGQVFVVAEAESLSGEAGDALLKLLEEPPIRTPRNFFLLAASKTDLLPTLRSRSLSIFLGRLAALDPDEVEGASEDLGRCLDTFFSTRSSMALLAAASSLAGFKGWEDPRARKPWALSAAALLSYLRSRQLPLERRRALLDLAAALLDGPRYRVRGITQSRLLEGFFSRHLADS